MEQVLEGDLVWCQLLQDILLVPVRESDEVFGPVLLKVFHFENLDAVGYQIKDIFLHFDILVNRANFFTVEFDSLDYVADQVADTDNNPFISCVPSCGDAFLLACGFLPTFSLFLPHEFSRVIYMIRGRLCCRKLDPYMRYLISY